MTKTERTSRLAVILLAILATAAALKYAAEVAAPVALALVVGLILSPLRDFLDRKGLPNAFAAVSTFLLAVVVIVGIVAAAQPIVSRGIETLPKVYREMNSALYTVQSKLRGLESMEQEVRKLVDGEEETASPDDPAPEEKTDSEAASEAIPTVEEVVLMAPVILAQMVIFLGVLFFFVLTRGEIYTWLAKRLGPEEAAYETAMRLEAAERQVSLYFTTISIINFGLGATVAAVMFAIGMPSPLIWGTLAFLLNYLLYIGPLALIAALLVAGITVFDGAYAILPAALYVSLNFMEAQFVTPSLLGKRLSVNPLLIFLSLTVFLWLWGPIGAIVAIPLMLWAIILTADIREIRKTSTKKADIRVEPATEAAGS